MLQTFGALPSGKHREKIQQSPHYYQHQYQNTVPTSMMSKGYSMLPLMLKFFNKPANCFPPKPLPFVKTDMYQLNGEKPVIIWFGHSSYFIRINNKNILVDPVLSGHASPFRNLNKAYKGTSVYTVNNLPSIDVLIITHDHYDHLDYETVKQLKPKVQTVCTSYGVSAHLLKWGYPASSIRELDWHQSTNIDNIRFTALPARHFSGRLLKRNQTLWSSFVLESGDYKFYLGGDSGYAPHFKEIGEQYGPFDMAILECGQYNLAWHDIHMLPEETVQASIDLKARVLMPVHWGKFTISLHPWNEPILRVTKAAKEKQVELATPMIGQPVVIGEPYPAADWWNHL